MTAWRHRNYTNKTQCPGAPSIGLHWRISLEFANNAWKLSPVITCPFCFA